MDHGVLKSALVVLAISNMDNVRLQIGTGKFFEKLSTSHVVGLVNVPRSDMYEH